MASKKPLVVDGGVTTQLADADVLLAAGLDRATAGTLSIASSTATLVKITPNTQVSGDLSASQLAVGGKFSVDLNGLITEYGDGVPANGEVLIGNGAGFVKSTLTAGSGITISNGVGAITISAAGGSGTVTSVSGSGGTTGMTLSGGPITTTGTLTLGGTLVAVNGGTGQTSYAVGDLLYANTTTTLAKLADVATGNALVSGGVGVAPSWGKVGLTTHVSGTLPVANGGTGQTTYTDGQLLIGNTTGNTLTKATLTAGTGISIVNGAGSVTISASGGGSAATDLSLITTGLTAGDVCYVTSTNNTTAAANATAVSTSNAIGIVVTVGGAGTGAVRTQGAYNGANFITGLTLVSGQTAYLSKTNGKLTNDVSAYTTGNVYVPVGTITNVITAAGGDGAADVAVNLGFSIVV